MIEKLEIKETRDTPSILFDAQNNLFEIKGNSLPEDTTGFFTPVFDWINTFKKEPTDNITLDCRLEYFNSSSAKMLYEIFFAFEEIAASGKKVNIRWFYEKDDKLIEEKGLEYKSVLEVSFELIEI